MVFEKKINHFFNGIKQAISCTTNFRRILMHTQTIRKQYVKTSMCIYYENMAMCHYLNKI